MNYAKLLDENSSVFQKRLIGLLDDTVTQSEIADKLNTSRQNVGNWIKGNTAPDIFSLANIADKFNVSTDYLLGRTDIKSTNPETQDIYKYTGLTEEAIEKLKRTREDEDYEYKIVLHYTDKNGVTEVRDTGDLSAYIISKIIEHSKATELLID
ncbi:MAG: helix-turn-helix domain-containing protein, partial [Oscillospiraceae bacterium]